MVKLKVLLFAMDGQGHVNAILGLAKLLSKAGHEIVISLSKGWESKIAGFGYQFVPLNVGADESNGESTTGDDNNNNDSEDTKDQSLKTHRFIEKILASFRKDVFEALDAFDEDSLQTYLEWSESMLAFDKPLEEAINQVKPDVIIVDFILRLPCIIKGSTPWILMWSCSPVALYKGFCPPEGTGFPADSPKELWDKFYRLYAQKLAPVREKVNVKLIEAGVEPYREDDSLYFYKSPYLSIYNYPEALDYTDVSPCPDKCYRMDIAIREPDQKELFVLPDNLANKHGALIYFSLGTLGSSDLELVRRVVSSLAKLPYRFIISKGPHGDQIELPENMWGGNYVNQIAILPHVDLVITHGGNNTVTESLYFGKPMIVLPLFYDQLDNAQRIVDKKLGCRLDTYKFTDEQMAKAIEQLLNDQQLYSRLEKISFDLRNAQTREKVVKLIEQTAKKQ